MTQPPTKRKVMGRIDLAQEPSGSLGYSPRSALSTPRSTYSSPPTSSAGSSIRKATGAGHVRARVDMSALNGMSSLSPPADGTPPLRRNGSATSAISGASLAPSPFARVNASSAVAGGSPRHGSSSSVQLSAPSRTLLEESTHSGNVTLRKHRARGAAHNRSMDASSSFNGSSIITASPGRAASPAHAYNPSPSASVLLRPRTAGVGGGHARPASVYASPASSNATPVASTASRPNKYGRHRNRSRTPSPSPPASNSEFLHPGLSNGSLRRNAATLSPTSSYESPSGSPSLLTSALPGDSDGSAVSVRRRSSAIVRDTSGSASPTSTSVSVSISGSAPRRAMARNGSIHATAPTSLTQSAIVATGSGGVSPVTYTDPSFTSTAQTPGPYSPALATAADPGPSAPFASLIASGLLSPSLEVSAGLTPAEATEAAEARVHRRLLDLEITNKSLLVINDSLEKTKLRQTKELSDLRRKLREGRFSLAGAAPVGEADGPGSLDDDEDYLDAEDGEEEEGEEDPELEASHLRCKTLIEHMMATARAAIAYEFVDETAKRGGNRVLHPVEMAEREQERKERRRLEKEAEERKLAQADVSLSSAVEEQLSSADVTLDSSQDETVSTSTAEESDGTTDVSLSELSSSLETGSDATEVPDLPKSPLYGDISVD